MSSFDEEDDRDMPDPSDMDQDDYSVMSRCPQCKKMIDEESEICPRCGYFIPPQETPGKYPIWVVIGIGLAMLGIFVGWILQL